MDEEQIEDKEPSINATIRKYYPTIECWWCGKRYRCSLEKCPQCQTANEDI